jgi:hypothetical protein
VTGCRCSEASLDAFVLLDADRAGGEAAWRRTRGWATALLAFKSYVGGGLPE